ncbi:DMT family transporter [Opitutus terrae]|uniref:DMT family transporter n=1 Tax=Opitutus terrae TaxID=107709 RepID=UPI000324CDB5|nr:DMT family transporter [Opitutus terrae]
MKDPAHARAIGLLVIASFCWSLGGLLIKAVDWPPLAVAGMRGLFAGLFLLATNRPLRFTFSRAQLIGALGYAACTVTFVAATKLTTAANAILLQYTAPVWIALFGAWLIGERATRADWLTIVVVLAGMTLFFAGGLDFSGVLGNSIAILSGVCFAAMTLALRSQKDQSPVESIILGNLLAFLVGLPWIVSAPPLNAVGWFALLLLGIVQLGVSYWLYARAIRHVTALEASIIPVIEPILNPVWVMLMLGETPTSLALLGGVIVLTAITLRAIASIRGAASRSAPHAPRESEFEV